MFEYYSTVANAVGKDGVQIVHSVAVKIVDGLVRAFLQVFNFFLRSSRLELGMLMSDLQ